VWLHPQPFSVSIAISHVAVLQVSYTDPEARLSLRGDFGQCVGVRRSPVDTPFPDRLPDWRLHSSPFSDLSAKLALSGRCSDPSVLVLYSLPSMPPPLAGTGIPLPVGTTWRWG